MDRYLTDQERNNITGSSCYFNKNGLLVIQEVAIPFKLEDKDRFIPPDLEPALRYYKDFIKYSHTNWSAARYLEELCGYVSRFVGNGYEGNKVKIMEGLINYLGAHEVMRAMGGNL